MNRRDILKQIAVVSGGLMLIPSCDFSKNDILEAYDKLNVTSTDKTTLQKLCNTILPTSANHKGRDDLELSDFVLVMINDCYGPEKQKDFMAGLKNLNNYANEQSRQNFTSMPPKQAEVLLRHIIDQPQADSENKSDQAIIEFEQIRHLVQTAKSLSIQGYMASEYYMTQVMPYKLVPGPFHGKALIQENEKVNIYG